VYEEFFLTSVGDNAADFLGDAAFERGDAENAERYWRSILEKHPDSDLPEARILFKRGLALAEQKQATGVATVIRSLEQRFPGQTAKVGGKDVKPADYLTSRLKAAESAPSTDAASLTAAIQGAPVAETLPAWRTQFLSDKAVEQRNSTMRSYWYYRNGMETLVPTVTSDGKRLYANWFGIVFAIDVASGKLAWRSQKFNDLNQHFSNMPHSGANMEAYRIVAKDGIVLAVLMPIERINYGNEPSRLVCYEAETGKVKWKSMDLPAPMNQMGFVGTPLIEDQEILALSHGQNDAKLSMVCLDFAGKQKWSADLGTVRKRQTNSGYQKMPQPAILRKGRSVYIASEDGALAAFDLLDRKIRWLLPYGVEDSSNSGARRIYYSGQTDERTQLHTETQLLEKDGLLYVKEAGGRELLAIDPAAPSVVWRRPAEDSSQLVGVDEESVFLLDNELSCINRKDRKLRWATRLPITSGGLSMLAGTESILVLTSRGVFQLDRKTGKVTGIFRGADLSAGGGRIALVGDRLISVTTQSVTSYPAPQPAEKKPEGKGSE
jgi:outer membrane protein assembly factor BamB